MSSMTTNTTKLITVFGIGLATFAVYYMYKNGSKRLSELKVMKMAVTKWKSLDTNGDGKVRGTVTLQFDQIFTIYACLIYTIIYVLLFIITPYYTSTILLVYYTYKNYYFLYCIINR